VDATAAAWRASVGVYIPRRTHGAFADVFPTCAGLQINANALRPPGDPAPITFVTSVDGRIVDSRSVFTGWGQEGPSIYLNLAAGSHIVKVTALGQVVEQRRLARTC